MESNCVKVQISSPHPPTTLKEKKLIWMEKQMGKRQEKTMKVGDKVPWHDGHKVLTMVVIELQYKLVEHKNKEKKI